MNQNKKKGTEKVEEKTFAIMSAIIKDDFCHYSFEVIKGTGLGDKVTVKGVGVIDEDMKEAFRKFNVDLAVIDDVFMHKGIEIKDIDKLHNHEMTSLFYVDGFKIKGSEDQEQIILIGSKHLNSGGRMELETPPIPLDNLSSYPFFGELKQAADTAREEVELYKGGKYTMVEEPENPDQLKIGEELPD